MTVGNLLVVAVHSAYNLVRMRHEIIFSPEAAEDFRNLRADIRAAVRDAIERHLRHEPTRTSKSRIKRLRGLSQPQFRLRVGDVRIFYDVVEGVVEILAIIPKSEAAAWLERVGKADEEGPSIRGKE